MDLSLFFFNSSSFELTVAQHDAKTSHHLVSVHGLPNTIANQTDPSVFGAILIAPNQSQLLSSVGSTSQRL
jgi:protoheme ferro-lyase